MIPAKHWSIAIEKLDDVSFEKAGAALELIQTKHHLRATANLTDASPDLWKTVRTWSKSLPDEVTAAFQVWSSRWSRRQVPRQEASRPVSGLPRDSASACENLTKVANTSGSAENKAAYDAFLGLTPIQRLALVESVYVLDKAPAAADLNAEITRLVQHAADGAKHLAAFVERLQGWWLGARVVERLAGGVSGPITAADLRLKLADLRHSFQPDNLPLDFAVTDPPEGADPDGDMRVFGIKLYRLIAANNDRIRFAITDYFRAFSQRSRWLRDDLVHAGELEAYEARLIEELERHKATIRDDGPEPQEDSDKAAFGRKLLRWVEKDAQILIRAQVNEPFVMRGSFHLLADQQRLGWHPDFMARLRALFSGGLAAS